MTTGKSNSRRGLLASGLALGLLGLVGAGVLAWVQQHAAPRIEAQQQRMVLQTLNQMIAPDAYDNALHQDRLILTAPAFFRSPAPVVIYRARRGGQPVAALMELTTPDGYNGNIRLLLGIRQDGVVLGVRVLSHKETPGLGDGIERRKSDWITQFDGRSLGDPPAAGWAVQRQGGVYDQLTGATITSRAVIQAVQRGLEYFRRNREMIFQQPATAMDNDNS